MPKPRKLICMLDCVTEVAEAEVGYDEVSPLYRVGIDGFIGIKDILDLRANQASARRASPL